MPELEVSITREAVARAAREVAFDYGMVGTDGADRIADAFEKFAEKLDAAE